MISKAVLQLLNQRKEKFLIPAEIVANVQENNSLEHAFLVLSKVKYAKIPVLDQDQHFKGLLSLAMITETMLGLTGIDPTRLGRIQVKDVMQTDVPTICPPYDMEEILHLLVDQTFLAVVDENADKNGTQEAAKEYLSFLYTQEAQRLAGENFYRPTDEAVLQEFGDVFDLSVKLCTIDDFGGWDQAYADFFADDTIFDEIYNQ